MALLNPFEFFGLTELIVILVLVSPFVVVGLLLFIWQRYRTGR